MAQLVPARPALAPPTDRQLDELKTRLRQCIFVEHAAALAGIPRRVLSEWMLQGRAGHPDFVPFVELIDEQLAELSDALVSPIVEAAKSGNIKATMWLFDRRVKPYEERAMQKQFDLEDRMDEQQRVVEAHVASSEAQQLADDVMRQLTADGSQH